MSTLTVVKKNNEICIASDSQVSFGSTKLTNEYHKGTEKIIAWGDSYIGIVGGVVTNHILQDIIKNSKKVPNFSSKSLIYDYFNTIHQLLKEKYFLNPHEDDDHPVESSQMEIVIVNTSGIFGVHSLREVYQYEKFWSYGSGKEYAIGAMDAIYHQENFDAEKIARAGVQAGLNFDTNSGGEIVSKKINISN